MTQDKRLAALPIGISLSGNGAEPTQSALSRRRSLSKHAELMGRKRRAKHRCENHSDVEGETP
jgi:hypothetical protein